MPELLPTSILIKVGSPVGGPERSFILVESKVVEYACTRYWGQFFEQVARYVQPENIGIPHADEQLASAPKRNGSNKVHWQARRGIENLASKVWAVKNAMLDGADPKAAPAVLEHMADGFAGEHRLKIFCLPGLQAAVAAQAFSVLQAHQEFTVWQLKNTF